MSTTTTTTSPRRPAGLVVGVGIAIGIVVAILGLLATKGAQPLALGDPGPIVRWGLPVLVVTWEIAAVATVGLLGLAAFLMPERGSTNRRRTAMRYATRTGTLWAVASALTLYFTFADLVGAPPTSAEVFSQFTTFVFSLDLTRVLALTTIAALFVTVGASVARSRATMTWLTFIGLLAIVINAITGHAGNAEGHATAVNAMGFHLIGVAVWVGGLIGLVLMRRHLLGRGYDADLGTTVERYSTLALWAYVAVALSGIQSSIVRLNSFADLTSAYGVLILLKALILTALGVFGWQQRRSVIAALRSSPTSRATFARLAVVEVVLMATAMGLAVALGRTPPPGEALIPETDIVRTLTGFPDPGPLTAMDFLVSWRIDWLFLTIAVLAIGLYLAGVRQLRKRGDAWPLGRTVCWIAGWLLFLYMTCGAPGIWGRIMFSTHMIMHMGVAMIVPLLLVPGAPVTLALRALKPRKDKTWGPRELILQITHSRMNQVLTNPVFAAVLFFISMAVFYYSPAFELALRTHTGHLVMTAHFILTGYLFTWVLIGIDPGPRRWNPLILLVVLFVTISFHAFFGVILTGTNYLLAPNFFETINLPWLTDPFADQYRAGEIAWGVGEVPTLILALMVARNWVRQDRTETKRKDRQARRDGDAELAAYNEMLAQRRRETERMGG
ncbi:MAG TPA: bifunctional copper resistance protein CopD/cytochrome c oxidase assembly protein [Intrasporangiaceae bacterium]|nr:bifunctional copper resistance protein CopD/cytochrome c oxidase assembly protein [Intrasporangiaceae bacterium]